MDAIAHFDNLGRQPLKRVVNVEDKPEAERCNAHLRDMPESEILTRCDTGHADPQVLQS